MVCHPLSHWNLHNFDPPVWLSWVHFFPHSFLWSRVHVPSNLRQNNPKEKGLNTLSLDKANYYDRQADKQTNRKTDCMTVSLTD